MEEIHGFKFSLDLSDFESAPSKIKDALSSIEAQAEQEGKNADLAMNRYLQELIAEREKAVAGLKDAYEKAKRTQAEAFAEWQNNPTKENNEFYDQAINNTVELEKNLVKLEDELKNLHDAEREVSNNASFLNNLKMKAQSMNLYGKAMAMLPQPIAMVIQSTKGLNKVLLALTTNPIVMMLAGLVVVIKSLYNYADFLSERFEGVTRVFGTVTEAVRKAKESFMALVSLDWDSLKYNLSTMFDGGQREIDKRNEKLLKAEEDHQKKLNDIENHWLRRRMNNTSLSYEERLQADKKFQQNQEANLKMDLNALEREYKIWLDQVALYDAKLNPNENAKKSLDLLSKDELAKYKEWQSQFAELNFQIETSKAESLDRQTKIRERQFNEGMKELASNIQMWKKQKEYNRQVREQLIAENKRLEALGRQTENNVLQAQINDMAEGLEKTAKQAELKAKKAIEALDEALYNEAKKLFDDEKKIYEGDPKNEGKSFGIFDDKAYRKRVEKAKKNIGYDANIALINQETEGTNKKAIEALTNQYKTYADKRLDIEKNFIERRSAFEKAGMQDSEQAQMMELERMKLLFAVDMEEFQSNGFIKTALANISVMSKESLQMLEKEIDKFQIKEAFSGMLTPEMMDQLDNLRSNVDDALTPFKTLKETYQECADAQNELNEAIEKGDPEQIAKKEEKLVKTMGKLKTKQDEYWEAIEKCSASLQNLGSLIGGAVGQMMQLAGQTVNVVRSVGETMKSVTTGAVSAIKAIEMASVILEVISLVMQFANAVKDMLQTEEEAERSARKARAERKQLLIDMYEGMTDAVTAYKQALIEAKYAEEELWSGTNTANMQKTLEQMTLAEEAYETRRQEMYNQTAKTILASRSSDASKYLAQNGGKNLGLYSKGAESSLDILALQAKDWYNSITVGDKYSRQILKDYLEQNNMAQVFSEAGEFNLTAWEKIKDEAPEVYDNIDEVARKDIDALAELAKSYEEYKQEMAQSMADWYSPILDNMTDAWMNWLNTGESVMDSFKDYSADTFKSIVQDMLKSALYKDLFTNYQKQIETMTNDYLNNSDVDTYAKNIGQATDEMMQQLESDKYKDIIEAWQTALKPLDIDLSSTSGRNADARGIARASQESVDENNARLAMMQQHTYSINSNVSQLVQTSALLLQHLQGIHTNTNELQRLAKIESSLANIETYGIKTK